MSYRDRFVKAQKYWADAPIRDERIDYISRRFYLGPVPVGQEREDLLKEFASLGADPTPLRKKVEDAERRKQESFERHERLGGNVDSIVRANWKNPEPSDFIVQT